MAEEGDVIKSKIEMEKEARLKENKALQMQLQDESEKVKEIIDTENSNIRQQLSLQDQKVQVHQFHNCERCGHSTHGWKFVGPNPVIFMARWNWCQSHARLITGTWSTSETLQVIDNQSIGYFSDFNLVIGK